MTHTHSFNEITTYRDTERRFRCAWCPAETTKPFPVVNPYTGVIESDTEHGFTREDVTNIRAAANYWQPSDGDAAEWDAFATNQKALRDLANRIEARLPPE